MPVIFSAHLIIISSYAANLSYTWAEQARGTVAQEDLAVYPLLHYPTSCAIGASQVLGLNSLCGSKYRIPDNHYNAVFMDSRDKLGRMSLTFIDAPGALNLKR